MNLRQEDPPLGLKRVRRVHDFLPIAQLTDMLQEFETAQRKSIILLQSVIMDLREGQDQASLDVTIRQRALEMGFDDWLSKPTIYVEGNVIQNGSFIRFHIQPTRESAFGSVGCSLIHGGGESKIVERAKELCVASCTFANFSKCIGEVFVFAQSWANNNCGQLEDDKKIGHICFERKGKLRPFWPTGMRVLSKLRRHQVQWYNPRRLEGIFAIHPGFMKDGERAGFGEMIYIQEGVRKILGRDSLDEIGVF